MHPTTIRTAQAAGRVPALDFEGVVFKAQAFHRRIGRHGVDTFLTPRAEQLECGRIVHFRIVEFRRRRGIHDIATFHLDRIGIGGRDAAVAGDVLIELDVHEPVFFQGVHLARLGFARLQEAQRFRDWHLIDQHLTLT